MALALVNKTNSSVGTQTATTASVTFANNTLYICSLSAKSSSGNVAFVTPVTTGLTWVQVALSNAALDTVAIYCAYVASGAGAATTALDSGQVNTSRFYWSIEEVTGSAGTAGTNGSAAFGTPGYEQRTAGQTSASVTLGTFADAVNNVALGVVHVAANAAITAEASYTALANTATTGAARLVEYILGQDLAVTATFASNITVATAVELKMLVAGGATTHQLGLTGVGA